EKAQLDNPAVLRIGRGQFLQSVVERDQFHFWFVTEALSLCKGQPQLPAAAFCRATHSRVVDQDVPHDLRSQAKELRAMFHRGTALVGQTDIRFMDQGGGLQRIGIRLTAQITGGQFAELVIDERNQLIKRSFVATAPFSQQLSDALIWWYC